MKLFKIAAAVVALTFPLASFTGPAHAATASNSQAGANGHNKNNVKNVGSRAMTTHHCKM